MYFTQHCEGTLLKQLATFVKDPIIDNLGKCSCAQYIEEVKTNKKIEIFMVFKMYYIILILD